MVLLCYYGAEIIFGQKNPPNNRLIFCLTRSNFWRGGNLKKENDISNARLLNIISMNNESTNIEKVKNKVHDGVAISPFMSTKVDAAAISAEREPNGSLSDFIDKSIAQYAKK